MGDKVTAHAGSGLDRNFVRLLVGDRVVIELSPRDLTRGTDRAEGLKEGRDESTSVGAADL